MDRKEFWKKYQADPVGTWNVLSEREKAPRVRELYTTYAEVEAERVVDTTTPTSIDTDTQAMGAAQELLMLAQDGPSIFERFQWFLSDQVKGIATWAPEFIAAYEWIALGVVVVGGIFFFMENAETDRASAAVSAAGFVSLTSLGLRVSNNTKMLWLRTAIPTVVIAVWVALGFNTYHETSVYDSREFGDGGQHAVYIVRGADIRSMAIFSPGTHYKWLNRTAFKDRIERFSQEDRVIRLVEVQQGLTIANALHTRHTYAVDVTYSITPLRVETPLNLEMPHVADAAQELESAVSRILLAVSHTRTSSVYDIHSQGDYEDGMRQIESPLFQVRIKEVRRIPQKVEIFAGNQWYEVHSPELPRK